MNWPATPPPSWTSWLDQAEAAARELLERYPEVHDGYDRLGMVYEVPREPRQAADCYRKVVEFVRAHSEQYDPQLNTTFERLVGQTCPSTRPAGRNDFSAAAHAE